MRELTYAVEGGIGPWIRPKRGSFADLIWSIPYFVTTVIPPIRIVNDMLVEGRRDAGMSGGSIWKPFEISDDEFAELVAELKRQGPRTGRDVGDLQLEVFDAPPDIQDWRTWTGYWIDVSSGKPSRPYEPETERDRTAAYDEWYEALRVPELYLGYLEAVEPEWREKQDDQLPLPAPLIVELRLLDHWIYRWAHDRGGPQNEAWKERVQEIYAGTEDARASLRQCVEGLGLPRWPFDRFSLPL